MVNGYDTYTVETAKDLNSHLDLHKKFDIYPSGTNTLKCMVPSDSYSPVLWIHGGEVVMGCTVQGPIKLWDREGNVLQCLEHHGAIDITVC